MRCLYIFLLLTNSIAKDIYLQPKEGTTSDIAIDNGFMFYNTIQDASPGDRIILDEKDIMYFIPSDIIMDISNITIQLDGNIYLHNNISAWNDLYDNQTYLNAIDIRESNNVTITSKGEGIIDGQGKEWWSQFWYGKISRQRPTIIYLENCVDTVIENVTLLNSPRFNIYGENVLRFEAHHIGIWVEPEGMFPFNTDGIDVSGKDIYIHDCMISNYDDAICIKPSDYNTPSLNGINMSCTENILVDNIYVYKGAGLSVGSVASTKQHCIRNAVFQNIIADDPIKFIYIKTGNKHDATNIQGYIENITYRNMVANNALLWSIYIGPQQQEEPDGTGDGLWPEINPYVQIRDIYLDNVNIKMETKYNSYGLIRCDSINPCTNIQFKSVVINDSKRKYTCSDKGSIIGTYDKNTTPIPHGCGMSVVMEKNEL